MIIPTGFAQINFFFVGDNAPTGAQITLGVDHSATSATPITAAEDIGTAFVDNIIPGLSQQITLEKVAAKFGPNDLGPFAEFAFAEPGLDSGDSEGPAVSMLVQKRTLTGGRAGRGRMFVPGIQEDHFDASGQMDGADVTAYNTAWSDFRNALLALDFVPVVLHGDDSPLTTPTVITAFQVSATAATQRRRQRR